MVSNDEENNYIWMLLFMYFSRLSNRDCIVVKILSSYLKTICLRSSILLAMGRQLDVCKLEDV